MHVRSYKDGRVCFASHQFGVLFCLLHLQCVSIDDHLLLSWGAVLKEMLNTTFRAFVEDLNNISPEAGQWFHHKSVVFDKDFIPPTYLLIVQYTRSKTKKQIHTDAFVSVPDMILHFHAALLLNSVNEHYVLRTWPSLSPKPRCHPRYPNTHLAYFWYNLPAPLAALTLLLPPHPSQLI